MELKVLFKEWLEAEGLSKLTVRDYMNCFERFPVAEFEQINVNLFLKKDNPRTVDRAFITNLKDFLCQTFPEKHEEYNKIRLPRNRGRKKRILPDYPTEEEMLKIADSFTHRRGKIMTLISFYSALRPQGILKLTKANFLLDKWLMDESKPCDLKINEKGNKERMVFLKSSVMKEIKDILLVSPPERKLFKNGYESWRRSLAEASLKALGRAMSPHKLRHGGATWLLTKKKFSLQEVSEFLGHESIATTQIYAHLDKQEMEDKYSKL